MIHFTLKQQQQQAAPPNSYTPQMKPTTKPKTADQFLKELQSADMSIAAWARQHKQPVMTVYMLCYGRIQGVRGKARTVARAMGLQLPDAGRSAGKPTAKEAA